MPRRSQNGCFGGRGAEIFIIIIIIIIIIIVVVVIIVIIISLSLLLLLLFLWFGKKEKMIGVEIGHTFYILRDHSLYLLNE